MNDAELLKRLVAFDSVSRNSNLPIAEFLCEYLDRPGVKIERNPSPDDAKTNLVITIGPDGEDDRRGLVLSGHTDVVPADEDDWRSDPFNLAQLGESYVGRGSSDMKGFIAIAANAAAQVDPKELAQKIDTLIRRAEDILDDFPQKKVRYDPDK